MSKILSKNLIDALKKGKEDYIQKIAEYKSIREQSTLPFHLIDASNIDDENNGNGELPGAIHVNKYKPNKYVLWEATFTKKADIDECGTSIITDGISQSQFDDLMQLEKIILECWDEKWTKKGSYK